MGSLLFSTVTGWVGWGGGMCSRPQKNRGAMRSGLVPKYARLVAKVPALKAQAEQVCAGASLFPSTSHS